MSVQSQPAILDPGAPYGRSLSFTIRLEADPRAALAALAARFEPDWGVVGLGQPLVLALGASVPGLRVFPALASGAATIPSQQHWLWVMLRGADRGDIFDRSQAVVAALAPAFELADAVDTFKYREGRDLTGYEDGTENPKDAAAVEAAVIAEGALAGSSFAAVQRWAHDLARFNSHAPDVRDAMMGRRLEDNEELTEAPESSHVKRSAQESFEPTAYMVRRSMPWANAQGLGLEFIAYGATLDAFEAVLKRMAGAEDGVADALFTFSRPVNGGYYFCPALKAGRIDLGLLGL
jgi:putative iron-dependent peroxidase